MKKNNQIGQGIGALLTPNKSSDDVEQNNILISRITPNPNQPRKVFDEKSLKQLAQSIDEKGLITPITVKASNNKYIIVAGERRFRAHQLLKRKRILAYIIDADSNKDKIYKEKI
jgi:ParB family chromosome partitioning protein